MSNADPSTPSQPPPGPGPSNKTPERDLIEAALRQAEPRSDFPGIVDDLPREGTFPGYEILREIHRGGQGVVYLALQKATKRKVALKVLHTGPFAGSSGRARFEREVAILGQLNHPNIVRIHDSGVTTDGSFFYVMDYIPGRTLDELIRAKDKKAIDDAIRLFIKICDAVNAAHLKGVIHRDLKPANVRLDAGGDPIVVDFGLAKLAIPETGPDAPESHRLMTMTGQFIGSLPWASPEQAEGLPSNIDVRTDVYSLGVILYQLLTGKFPYEVVGNMRDVLDNILKAEPARPSTIRRQINGEVETIVLKCLAKERERRYQSAGELARDLRHYLAGEPIEAKRASGLYVLSKMVRRHRGPVAAGVAALVALVAFSIAMTVLYRQAVVAREGEHTALEAQKAATLAESEQRARAERNFIAGHELAMAMITDIEGQIKDLRGATRAREALLTRAQAYLESLRTEAGDDPSLLLDLARAHERVGSLQGELYMRRLGDTAGAESHFARAREIREALMARLPNDPRVRIAMARSVYRAGGGLVLRRDFAGARAEYAKAVALYDEGLALAARAPADTLPIDQWREDRAWTEKALGDALYRMADAAAEQGDAAASRQLLLEMEDRYAAVGAYWKERLSANEGDEVAARGLGVLGDDRARALTTSARALAASGRKLGAQRPEEAAAQYEAALSRLADARAMAFAARDEFARLSDRNPTSFELRRDTWAAMHRAGQTYAEAAGVLADLGQLPGREARAAEADDMHRRALDLFQQAAGIARRLGDTDAASLEARRDLSVVLISVGDELRALKRWQEADAAYSEASGLRDSTLRADPLQRNRLDLGVAYFKRGALNRDWGTDAAGPERAARLDAAEAWLTRALGEFETLRQAGALAADNPYTKEAGAMLDAVRALRESRGGG